MSTVVAVETPTGVAIAGDTRVVDGEAVSSDRFRRVFGLGDVGAGVVGDPGAVQQFRRRFEVAVQDREQRSGDPPDVDAVARIAAREARSAGVDAVVGAREADGTASLREVASDGRVLEGGEVALGTGSAVALGLLEALDTGEAAEDPAAAVRNVLETAMERDADTGGEVDVWTLGSADRTEQDVRRSGEEAER
jgi:proteasome beta subunit